MYTENLIKALAKTLDIDISKLDMNELIMGMDVELEHGSVNQKTNVTNDDPQATFKIVMAHMNEMPNYYTKLKKMESGKKTEEETPKKENINEFAKRMRELAGFSEGNQKKSLKTIQEGKEEISENESQINEDTTESEQKSEEDFEVHKFNQKPIEEGEDDEKLYNLNENTIIVLDFIEDEDNK